MSKFTYYFSIGFNATEESIHEISIGSNAFFCGIFMREKYHTCIYNEGGLYAANTKKGVMDASKFIKKENK